MQVIHVVIALASALVIRILYSVVKELTSPAKHIPGPFIARFTRLWYLKQLMSGDFERKNISLHRKYADNVRDGSQHAPVVRLGPNLFSIAKADKAVYDVSSKMTKSAWYEAWHPPSPEKWTIFADREIDRHRETRKKFQAIYSLSSLVGYEVYVDECARIFEQRLREMARGQHGEFVNLGHWLQCYAFDVIGNITYSKRFGFLDAGKDVDMIMNFIDISMSYSSYMGVYSWLHPYAFKVLQMLPGNGAAGMLAVFNWVNERIRTREEQRRCENTEDKQEGPQDFLDKLMDLRSAGKKRITDYDIFIMSASNVFAGSDTTAISLSATLYHLIRNSACMSKLREEVDAATNSGRCESDRVSFKDSQDMPYLQAVIKEALRLHPAAGLPLWRTVGAGGAEVCGQWLPEGSEVGVNAWVAQHDPAVFGNDAEKFRPERWFEAKEQDDGRSKAMEAQYMPFGLGSRTCLGKHISYMEMTKLVPQLVRTFDFELQHPEREWKCSNNWFVKPKDFFVRVKLRSESS